MKYICMVLAATAGAIASGPLTSQAEAGGELHIYNVTDYTAPDLIKRFETESGIKVTLDTFDGNEMLLAKLQAGGTGYDIAVASSDFVDTLAKADLIQPIEASTFPEFRNLSARWQSRAWDPEARYSVPWVWGTTSFAVDTVTYKGAADSLSLLYDPPEELKGKIGMLGSPSEVMSLALAYLGKPQCNSNPDDLKALNALLEKQKPFVKVYNSAGVMDRLVSGETPISQDWSGEVQRAREQRSSIKYIYAKEGGIGWMDNVVVPKGAPNLENAKLFMRFMLRPENAAIQSNFVGYPNGVSGSINFVRPELASAPEFNLPADYKMTFVPGCDQAVIKAYDRIWTRLRQ